jgi:hypothetical protein
MTIAIKLYNQTSGEYFALCMIYNKSRVTNETFTGLAVLTYARLHHILSQQNQEGEIDRIGHRTELYQIVLSYIDQVALFFGEDAKVSPDFILYASCHGLMKYLYQHDLKIVFSVKQEEEWMDIVLTERNGWILFSPRDGCNWRWS